MVALSTGDLTPDLKRSLPVEIDNPLLMTIENRLLILNGACYR